jgi:hypothetical protein
LIAGDLYLSSVLPPYLRFLKSRGTGSLSPEEAFRLVKTEILNRAETVRPRYDANGFRLMVFQVTREFSERHWPRVHPTCEPNRGLRFCSVVGLPVSWLAMDPEDQQRMFEERIALMDSAERKRAVSEFEIFVRFKKFGLE